MGRLLIIAFVKSSTLHKRVENAAVGCSEYIQHQLYVHMYMYYSIVYECL